MAVLAGLAETERIRGFQPVKPGTSTLLPLFQYSRPGTETSVP